MRRAFTVVQVVFAASLILLAPFKGKGQATFVVDYFTYIPHSSGQLYTFVNFAPQGSSDFVCANIYVFSDEAPVACGGCLVSPNGTRSVYLQTLIDNPIRGIVPGLGVIKVVYSRPSFTFPELNYCDATNSAPLSGLKTFRQRGSSELELDEIPLSKDELTQLNEDCSAVEVVGGLGPGIITCPGTVDPPPEQP